jgi:hypothetical protein
VPLSRTAVFEPAFGLAFPSLGRIPMTKFQRKSADERASWVTYGLSVRLAGLRAIDPMAILTVELSTAYSSCTEKQKCEKTCESAKMTEVYENVTWMLS